ncbi:MAG: rRNA maturation RNase YbeY [Gammaproteobacteria bacterium]|nr:rRNA maturation RNase YbeY [Gammaproteobacteria bacterium]MBA3732172.1 rRNA maturation RNase YbeY [Gammaproteobacteria bacterium]
MHSLNGAVDANVSIVLDLHIACDAPGVPASRQFRSWAAACVEGGHRAEVVVRVVDEEESARLNEQYRRGNGATNVLSFAFEAPPQIESLLLGDVVICAPVIAREARAQMKCETSHWAHMVVHGMLHLQGFDHQTDAQAQVMEARETRIMAGMGFPDPYHCGDL